MLNGKSFCIASVGAGNGKSLIQKRWRVLDPRPGRGQTSAQKQMGPKSRKIRSDREVVDGKKQENSSLINSRQDFLVRDLNCSAIGPSIGKGGHFESGLSVCARARPITNLNHDF